MLMIQVLGSGLIPRSKGMAPKKEPFPATRKEIELILEHGTLIPRMYNPKTGSFITITTKNLNKLWDAFGTPDPNPRKPIVRKNNPAPVVEEEKVEAKKEDTKVIPVQPSKNSQTQNVNKKNDQKPVDTKVEEKKGEDVKDDGKIAVTTSSENK